MRWIQFFLVMLLVVGAVSSPAWASQRLPAYASKAFKDDIAATEVVVIEADTGTAREAEAPSVEVLRPIGEGPSSKTSRTMSTDFRNQSIVAGNHDVETMPIADVGADSFGVLSGASGGLGASMWQGTPRRMIDRVLPALDLPVASPVMNDLARRFLLTSAAVPRYQQKEVVSAPDMTSIRVEKLLALGEVDDAWRLAYLRKGEKLDEITLQRLIHAALLYDQDDDICEMIPKLIGAYSRGDHMAVEWQKALIFCQMKKDNRSAVSLAMDLLQEQKIKEDNFVKLVSKNYLRKEKTLPKDMTPLRLIDLAVLQMLDKTLPKELYERPSALYVPDLLEGQAESEDGKLSLAETEARRGQITMQQLEDVYAAVTFNESEVSKPLMAKREGAYARALYYQAAVKQTDMSARLQILMKFLDTIEGRDLAGTMGQVLAEVANDIPVSETNAAFAAQGARLYALAGEPDRAVLWRDLAKRLAGHSVEIRGELAFSWPIFVFSGLEADGDYAKGMAEWLSVSLASSSAQDRERRDYVGNVLLLLAAAGYAVPEDVWLRIIEAPPMKQGVITSPLLLERLAAVSSDKRVGETVLLSLLIAGSEGDKMSMASQIGIVRALRLAGLKLEARHVAQEAVSGIKIP